MSQSKTAKQILFDLYTCLHVKADWFMLGMTNPYEYRRQMSGCVPREDWDKMFEKRSAKRALTRLRKKKWIKDRHDGELVNYEIHNGAFIELLKHEIMDSRIELSNGEYTFVIFDIPEAAKSARNSFRKFLKQAGFKQKQLSVWTSANDVAFKLRQLIHLLKIEKWVDVYIARKS